MNNNNNGENYQTTLIKKDIFEGRREFLDLDFSDPVESSIALNCINDKENYLYMLDTSDKNQLRIVLAWLNQAKTREEKYERVYKLLKDQLCKEVLDFYLFEKIAETKETYKDVLDVYKGFDNDVILSYDFETKDGEALCYFDKTLGIPAKLIVNANFKLKIVDSLKLAKKLDIGILYLSFNAVLNLINITINTFLRDSILPWMEEQNMTFYQLSRNYTRLGNIVLRAGNIALGEIGIELSDIHISDISLANNAEKMLEEQYFALAEAERVNDFEQRAGEASLALYEKKAEIHEKYPKFPVSLTEAEKDFAFARYMKKENICKPYSTRLDDLKLSSRAKPDKLIKSDSPEIAVPKEPIAPRMIGGIATYAILFALFAIVSVFSLLYLDNKTIGLICLIATVVVFGIIGLILFLIASKNKKLYPSRKEYKKMYEEYEKQVELYNQKRAEDYLANK